MKTRVILATFLGLGLSTFLSSAADADAKPSTPAKPATPATPASPGRPDPLKKYDKNGDGKLDDAEKAAIRKEREDLRKEQTAQLLKKYDKNGNGKLDEDEQQARLEDLRKEREAAIARRLEERKHREQNAPSAKPATKEKTTPPEKK
jgi:flagellar motility protein MotE (MotC chaperone)